MKRVKIEEPARMNLLGLILASVIERNLEDDVKRRRCERLQGNTDPDELEPPG